MLDSLLDHLARSRGIGDAYYDYRGELKQVTPATKKAILTVMGCQVNDADALAREIAELDAARWRTLRVGLEEHGAARLDAQRLPAANQSAPLTGVRSSDLTEAERCELEGRWLTRRLLVLPDDLPLGYHVLRARVRDGSEGQCTLVVAPGRCYEPAVLSRGRRLWGVAVQLYTLRSASNWGIGDFADLESVVRSCAPHGASFVGLNPLHALFPSNPAHSSPYSPSTRHFLNVLYIAVESLPEFEECPDARRIVEAVAFQRELERLRSVDSVDYGGVAHAKLPVLALLFEHFRREHLDRDSVRAQAFRAFERERGEPLRLHALHDAIDAHMRGEDPQRHWGWPAWPPQLRDPRHPGVREFEAEHTESVQFHCWLQWLADEQLRSVQELARELGMPIGLYGDYAVGVNPGGSETWSDQDVYRMGAGIGAPPDALALKGQDWGIPPLDPHALIAERYRPFRDLVSANMRHFGALRLDHVMALFRQWWVPAGLGATNGGYVHYPIDDLMSVLALESARHRCLVVGEDLGTVPDEMRRAMAEFAVYSYKVLLFEKQHDGRFKRPGEYSRRAIATVTTHDLPTLRGYWEGRDIELRDRLQLFPGEEIRLRVIEERLHDRAQLLAALEDAGLCPQDCDAAAPKFDAALASAVHVYLAKSTAALVVLQIEDLLGMADPVNVPGTSHEHANWQRKVTADVAAAMGDEGTLRLFTDVQQARS